MFTMSSPAPPPPSPKAMRRRSSSDSSDGSHKNDAENVGTAALRVMLGVKEVDDLQKLREENARLKQTLKLWIGPYKIPSLGRHYFIEPDIILYQGKERYWEFEGIDKIAITPFRFDSTRPFKKYYDSKINDALEFVFVAPFFDHYDKPVEIVLETHDLCRIIEVNFEAFKTTPLRFLSIENKCCIYYDGNVYPINDDD